MNLSRIINFPNYKYNYEYIRYLKKENIYTLNMLPKNLRLKAIKQVYDEEVDIERELKSEIRINIIRNGFKNHINSERDSNKYRFLINKRKQNNKLRDDPRYMELFILENLIEFTKEGERLYFAD